MATGDIHSVSPPQGHSYVAYHPFLRATHSFDQSALESSVAGGCLDFEAGDLILLHSFHATGWGDGTNIATSKRGWIPSNYCEPYDVQQVRPLLVAVLNVLVNPRPEDARSSQIAVTTIVSGVRSLLDGTDCLSQDSHLVRESKNIGASRHALLEEVSGLLSCVKDQSMENLISENMVQHTYRILQRAAAFLDSFDSDEYSYLPSTPPVEYTSEIGGSVEDGGFTCAAWTFEYQPVSALARLNFLYDATLVCLGSFLSSSYIDNRAPAKLLLTTRRAAHACRELLALVETVSSRASPIVYSLEEAKEMLYNRITALVTAARDVVAAQSLEDQDIVVTETQKLIDAVVACVRTAGLCLAKSKYVLDQVGDFDLEVDRRYLQYQLQSQLGTSSRRSSKSESSYGMTAATSLDDEVLNMAPEILPSDTDTEKDKKTRTSLQDRIVYNEDGQVQGGSLEALVKQLTANNAAPDALFVSTFFLTFRLFTTPVALAQALVHRFISLSPDEQNVLAVRLRVYNALKGWMESHWRKETDSEAIPIIVDFANGSLKSALPFASTRLLDLSKKVVNIVNPLVPRSMSKLGIDKSLGILLPDSSSVPTPIVNKLHLAIVARYVREGELAPNILDFDPLELARQITVKESRLFCKIVPEELLGQEFSKKAGKSTAVNVKAMSSLSTDLANLIGESILTGDVKVRMNTIRHWIRVAEKCLELKNYNCLMAITCALQSSVILRLKKTWEILPPRYHSLFAELKSIIVYEKNYASYRTLLRNTSPPCIPYLGVYLTDLTFADEGNSDFRTFHPDMEDSSPIINFDKHVRTTKIIADLQRFQVPYRFQEVPELQAWLDVEVNRVHEMYLQDQHVLYRRSCNVEPKLGGTQTHGAIGAGIDVSAVTDAVSWNDERSSS
ncbi:ras guanine nucleotide exchange factor domain-containing protein [Lipomyces chichibuensis]|uniref:ras guanine nucleotide exchange factor domain-containing protein n=1 Tax=Lipomyces chichibuensis TaxID=1546026 RepID=UPI003343CA18